MSGSSQDDVVSGAGEGDQGPAGLAERGLGRLWEILLEVDGDLRRHPCQLKGTRDHPVAAVGGIEADLWERGATIFERLQ